jgi:hypothetical protein
LLHRTKCGFFRGGNFPLSIQNSLFILDQMKLTVSDYS